MKKIFSTIFLLITAIIPICLCLTFLCAYISPTTLWMPGIIALGFPLFLFLSAILGFYYLFRLKKRAIIFFAAILLNIPNIIHYIRLTSPAQEPSEQYKVKVLSYNVNLFDFYAQADKKNAIRNNHWLKYTQPQCNQKLTLF